MTKTLEDLSAKMKDIDYCMLATHTDGGAIGGRPMSNNREVDYDGTSWFYADGDTRMVRDIGADPQVNLSYQSKSGLFGARPFFLTIEGHATLIRDKTALTQHWTKGLDAWWPDGIDTPSLTLIRVEGKRAHYWEGMEEGELVLSPASV